MQTQSTSSQNQKTKIACIGASIVYGKHIPYREKNSFPAKLNEMLGESYHVENFGWPGAAVQRGSDLFYRDLPQYEEALQFDGDIYVVMIGTNDSKRINYSDEANFKKDYIRLLDSFISPDKNPLFLLLNLPDIMSNDFTNEVFDIEKIKPINENIRATAEEKSWSFVDINAVFSHRPDLYVEDGVHPNADGAQMIAESAYNVISLPEVQNQIR